VSFDDVLSKVEAVALGAGGRFLVLGGYDEKAQRTAVVYRSDGGTFKQVRQIDLSSGEVSWSEDLMLSADGRRLVVQYAGDDHPVRIFDDGVENQALRKLLSGVKDVFRLALSADGRYLAVSDQMAFVGYLLLAGRTRLLDTARGSWESLLNDEVIWSMAFSPDSQFIGVGSDEGVLHIFRTAKSNDAGDPNTLKEEMVRLQDSGVISAVAFSADNRYVATASGQRENPKAGEVDSYPLRVWLLCPAELIAESEKRLGSKLSVDTKVCSRTHRGGP
jgi:WD40 repeat protein